jgi:hypothetical protein
MVDRRRPPGPIPETCGVDSAMDVRRRTCQTIYQQDQCLGICRGSAGVLPSGSLQEATQPCAKLVNYREVRGRYLDPDYAHRANDQLVVFNAVRSSTKLAWFMRGLRLCVRADYLNRYISLPSPMGAFGRRGFVFEF